MGIADRIKEIEARTGKARQDAPLAAPATAVLAASKGQPVAVLEEALRAGLLLYGENRVQEAAEKWPELRKRHPGVRLHLIGPLQTNKVKEALSLFDAIQTVDRPKLAESIATELVKSDQRTNGSTDHRFFIQVNTGEEPQKAGIAPKEAGDFIRYCRDDLKLPVIGLMCIPPAAEPPAPHFALLRKLALKNNLGELSMGMSEDFETAIRMGSTCVRIGRALFGERG